LSPIIDSMNARCLKADFFATSLFVATTATHCAHSDARKAKEAQLRAAINQQLIESGEKER
jgi:hypothetical protein